MQSIISIINKDRLEGQPLCTPEMLVGAVGGRASSDAHLWQLLEEIATLVLDLGDGPVAIVSYARWRHEPVGQLLWLHAGEQHEYVQACIDHVLETLDVPVVRAFNLSPVLTVGVEGLPTLLRATTHDVLIAAGFEPEANWTYMTKSLDQNVIELVSSDDTVVEGRLPQWLINFEKAGEYLGHAEIGVAGATGVIWYILVEQSARRNGIARCLMQKAERILVKHGAQSFVACVDEGTADELRDRFAAKALLGECGFRVVDLVQSFSLNRQKTTIPARRFASNKLI